MKGGADFGFGGGDISNNATGGVGHFTHDEAAVGFRLGKVFTLVDTLSARPTALLTKAPPKPVAGGYVIGLDLSGGLGYFNWHDNGYTDSSGTSFGAEQVHYGDLGARAKLFIAFPRYGYIWMPYVAGTVDQLFGYSHTFAIPAQGGAGADTVAFGDATTFWGAEFGVDARAPNGWIIGAKGFYQASADTSIAGGSGYVKIPFEYLPRAAQRY